jgi:hypothetical protein
LMEQKKQLLIKVFTKIKPYRDMAEGVLALLESTYCTDKTIDGLMKLLQDSLKTVKTDKEKSIFKKSLQLIKKIRNQEKKEKMTDEDLDKLLESN